RAARAGPVVDHEGLAELLTELDAEPSRDQVLRAARREGADNPHVARRPVGALRQNALCERQCAHRSKQDSSLHCVRSSTLTTTLTLNVRLLTLSPQVLGGC